MTEHENEYEGVPEGVDPMTGEVLEPEPEPAPVEPEPDAEPETEQQEPQTEQDFEAVYKRLDTRAANYIKSVGEILSDATVPVTLCEMCGDAYPGMRWSEPNDELHAALVAVALEQEQEAPLKEDQNTAVCDGCDGYGVVKLPSHVPGNQMRTCRSCNGAGYRELSPESGAPVAPTPVAPNGDIDVNEGVPLDDPSVIDLRSRGFMVMKVPALVSEGQ